MDISKVYNENNEITLFNGDCNKLLRKVKSESVDLVITSPPYCIGKEYEDPRDDMNSFIKQQRKIFPEVYRILKTGGSICWQTGYHITDSIAIPLDYYVYKIFTEKNSKLPVPLVLRNRIIWTFGHGLNSTQRFSGRHETVLWFTKGNDYVFNLDQIRIPQKYPGKRAYKGENIGQLSGNPLGKNPSDVWEIPNVKANHIEKTDHPCQFPTAIPLRFIKALTQENAVICDPYMGSGTTGIAAILEHRRFIGAELQENYYNLAVDRIRKTISGEMKIRPDVPVYEPNPNSDVARLPEKFAKIRESIGAISNEKEIN